MVKLEVTLDFANSALYEDFLEAAEAEGLKPDGYLMRLLNQELAKIEQQASGGMHVDTDG